MILRKTCAGSEGRKGKMSLDRSQFESLTSRRAPLEVIKNCCEGGDPVMFAISLSDGGHGYRCPLQQ